MRDGKGRSETRDEEEGEAWDTDGEETEIE